MNKTVKRIVVILIILILLPAAFLTINEMASLNQNEEVIGRIYSNQLDAILYSVNQYSEDVVSSWASRIDEFNDDLNNFDDVKISSTIDSFYSQFPSLYIIFVADSVNSEVKLIVKNEKNNNLFNKLGELKKSIGNILSENQPIVKRLLTYKQSGYRKLEPIKSDTTTDFSILLFIEETPKGLKRITGMMIDPKEFTYRILSPKIQEIAQQEFLISVFNREENFQFNSSIDFKVKEVQQSKSLWIFPNYSIGISLVGQTIEDLVQQRAITNILLIGLLTIVLLIGVWIVYRNIKKEVELAQIKSDFVSNVSHELRTPLSLISMFSETLEMDRVKTDEKKKEYYSIISQEANRLGKIVNSILNFSKMEAGKRQYNFVDSYLNDVTENVYHSYKFHLEQKGFVFNIVKDETIPIIKIDEEAVSEAIVNLVDNAVKYSANNKEITVRTGLESNYAFVEVEDKGIGIPEKDQKKIFDKFFRVSSGNVHNVKGSGLGLSIVKHIVDAHKGKIELLSEVGKGSKFRLLFPLSKG
ncbi:MAG: HAMP domain-containing sensor histidine kinase [Ignavibacteriaceae bacterium]|nr:HAMP domain-containing sensor histidine kinase [Ignavibacteriaceae bacterium]